MAEHLKSSGAHHVLKVVEIIRETAHCFSLTLEQPEVPIVYRPGQFINFYLTIKNQKFIRSYSLSSAPVTDTNLSVTIKEVPGGVVSNWLSSHLKVGQHVSVGSALGDFGVELPASTAQVLTMFAGGCGITPLMSIIKTTLIDTERKVNLIYFNRSEAEIIFYDTLKHLTTEFDARFKVIHVLSQPTDEWRGLRSPINETLFSELMRSIALHKGEDNLFLMCGPAGLMDQLQRNLISSGINEKKILRENFTRVIQKPNDPNSSQDSLGSELEVVTPHGTYAIQVRPGQSILDAVLDAGLNVGYGCKSGICGACFASKISGDIATVSVYEIGQPNIKKEILMCISYPKGRAVKIDCTENCSL